jgi:hypothetical protein
VEDGGPGQRRKVQRPATILIDSEELDSGESLSDTFRKLAAPEIEEFKRETTAGGVRPPQGRSSTAWPHSRPVLLRPRPGSRTGGGVRRGYRAFMATDTAFHRNPFDHTADDLPETLDYRRLARAVDGLSGCFTQLAASEGSLGTPPSP